MHRIYLLILSTILTLSRLKGVLCYSHTPIQYHIQTDEGPNRYFRFQTYNGQYRKEKRFHDGSVVGTYGWVDPTGLLRLFDYFADKDGYNIVRERKLQVGRVPQRANSIPGHRTKGVFESKRKPIRFPTKDPSVTKIIQDTQKITTPFFKATTTTRPSTTNQPTTTNLSTTTTTSKPKLRPLFVSKRKKKPINRFVSRRRQNFMSAREQARLQQSQKKAPQDLQQFVPVVDKSTIVRKPVRTKKIVRPHVSASVRREQLVSPRPASPPIEKFGFDNPGGRVTMNFDLGNQYRKEKVFLDGTVIGEHGYVDPFGILRITTFTSGPRGHHQAKKSYWVGTRTPSSE